MKFWISLLATALLSFVAGIYLPWWSIGLVAFLIAVVMPLRPWKNFIAGF